MKKVQERYSGISDALASKVVKKALELQKVSDKTGKPLGELYKDLFPKQSTPGKIAKVGMVAGLPVGAAIYGGVDALATSILKATEGSADTKPASTPRRKSPEGGQTIKENRRVVSETRLAKGGMTKKKYSKGGALKKAPTDAKGLKKLPTEVRNKMGYMAKGGAVKPASKSKKK